MAEKLFQIFFGNQTEDVLGTYRRISHLHASRDHLLQNKKEIEADLASFNDEHRDLEQDQAKLAKLESKVAQYQAELKKLKQTANHLDRTLDSGWQRFCANVMSSLSSSYDSVATMQEMRRQTKKEIGGLEGKLRKRQKTLGQFRQEVKHDSRSQDSFEFARDRLQTDIENTEQAIREANEAIDLRIQDLAVGYPLQALLHKRRQMTDDAARTELVNSIMGLRRATRSRAMLQSVPEATPAEREMAFGVVDVVKGVKRGFVEELADMAARIRMTGQGSAHKKVRSGNSTSWRKIDVAFSGSCNAVFRIESTDWGSEELVSCLQEQGRDQFVIGLTSGREKYTGKLLPAMEQEILASTTQLRRQLEASFA